MRPTDEDLVARHLRGDPEAFAELVARYTGSLFHMTFRFTADRSQAEDLTQETFLHALSALPRSQTDRPFRPWLFRIAVNLCRDWARRRKHRPLLFADIETGPEAHSPVDEVPDDLPSPLDELEAKERELALRAAVMSLPQEDRLLLTLRYDDELTYSEIGDSLGMPVATVGTHLFRAKRRMRAALTGIDRGGVR